MKWLNIWNSKTSSLRIIELKEKKMLNKDETIKYLKFQTSKKN